REESRWLLSAVGKSNGRGQVLFTGLSTDPDTIYRLRVPYDNAIFSSDSHRFEPRRHAKLEIQLLVYANQDDRHLLPSELTPVGLQAEGDHRLLVDETIVLRSRGPQAYFSEQGLDIALPERASGVELNPLAGAALQEGGVIHISDPILPDRNLLLS